MPSRKVFDIIPPRELKETVRPVKAQKRPVFPQKPALPDKPVVVGSARKIRFWPIFTLIAIVSLAGASYFLIKPKAYLDIWPVKKPLDAKTQAVVGSDIAGEVKTYDCPFSREFPATGVKSVNAKATGTIRIYNAYSTSPQTLIANTRFVSDNGKLFRIPQKIVIPGGHYEGRSLVPGEVDAKAEAGEPGAEYNIGPSTFSLPAFAGTPRYTAFYAKSFSSMSGGVSTKTTQISGQDLADAEKTLTATALSDCQQTLNDSLPPKDYIVVEDAVKSKIIESEASAKEGQEISKFTFNVKARATAFVFKQSALNEFAETYISTQVPEGMKLNSDSVVAGYLPRSVDSEKNKIILAVGISADAYSVIDENRIKEAVKSRHPDEIAEALKGFSEVSRFQLRLWPFWVNKAPHDKERITIKLRLD